MDCCDRGGPKFLTQKFHNLRHDMIKTDSRLNDMIETDSRVKTKIYWRGDGEVVMFSNFSRRSLVGGPP